MYSCSNVVPIITNTILPSALNSSLTPYPHLFCPKSQSGKHQMAFQAVLCSRRSRHDGPLFGRLRTSTSNNTYNGAQIYPSNSRPVRLATGSSRKLFDSWTNSAGCTKRTVKQLRKQKKSHCSSPHKRARQRASHNFNIN